MLITSQDVCEAPAVGKLVLCEFMFYLTCSELAIHTQNKLKNICLHETFLSLMINKAVL